MEGKEDEEEDEGYQFSICGIPIHRQRSHHYRVIDWSRVATVGV